MSKIARAPCRPLHPNAHAEKSALFPLQGAVGLTEVNTSTPPKGAHHCLPAEGNYLKSSSELEICTFPPFFQPKQAKKIYQYKEWEIQLCPKWLEHASKVPYLKLGKKLESPKTHLASFEEQALLPKLAWSNCFPWGEQGIWLWWVKSCNSADFQKALGDIRIQIWWKANETFTPKSLRSFWNFAHLSSKPCWSISLGNLRGWYYMGINSHFIDEETEVKWLAKGHTRSRVKGFRWRRISKVREGCFIT